MLGDHPTCDGTSGVASCQRCGGGLCCAPGGALHTMIVNSSDAILVVGTDQVVRLLNRAAEQLLGQQANELIGEHCDYPISEGGPAELEIVRPDGDGRVAEMRVARSFWQGDPVHMIVLRDITQRKRLEGRLALVQETHLRGHLSDGITHAFNNTLTSILCANDALLAQLPPGDPRRRHAERVQAVGARSAELTKRLLTFSRRSDDAPKVVDASAVVEDTVRMLRRTIGEDVRLVMETSLEPAGVRIDRGQLEQIVTTLVLNARETMRGKGTLALGTNVVGWREASGGDLAAGGGRDVVSLTVRQVDAKALTTNAARIFDPFYVTRQDEEGAPLGLALACSAVRQADGHVLVYGERGGGTSFQVLLPRAPLTAKSPRESRLPRAPSRPEQAQHGRRVLLAEDEEAVREIIIEMLEYAGYTVLSGCNGVEALRVLEQADEGIDLLVTDMRMPEMGGVALAEQVLESAPDLPVLFISGYAEQGVGERILKRANTILLRKPFSASEFLGTVTELLVPAAAAGATAARTASR